jgi:hypothetical protein
MPEHNCLRLSDITNLRIGHHFSPSAAKSVIHRLSCPRCLEKASQPATETAWANTLRPAPRFLRILATSEDFLTFSEYNARAKLREQGDIHPLWLEVRYSLACLSFEPPKTLNDFFQSPLPPHIEPGMSADYYTRFLIYRSKCRSLDQRAQALEDLDRADELRQRGTGDPELHATLLVARALYEKRFEDSQRLVEEALQTCSLHPERALELRLDLLQHMTCFPRLNPKLAIDLFRQTRELLATAPKPLYRIETLCSIFSHQLHDLFLKSPELPGFEPMEAFVSMASASPIITQPGRSIRHLPLSLRNEAITLFGGFVKRFKVHKSVKRSADSAEFQEVA